MRRPLRALSLPLLLVLVSGTAWAQFYSFGRNKVQYTDFQWQVLKTEHFDIYYYPEMQALAERGAFYAEESYRALELKFNHTLGRRVPLIFYSSHLHFQQTNTVGGFIPEGVGGFFEFLKGRVVIPSDGSMGSFQHVIRHELVHVFMHSKINRVLYDHRKTPDSSPPLWFVEGLAEYWSTDWDAQAEMVMRDAVLNNIAVGLDDIYAIAGSFLMYKEGQNALMYLAEHYGQEKPLLLMENFWKASSFEDVFRATIGKGYREFDEEWLYALKKEYYPLLSRRDAPSHASRTLVSEGYNFKPVVYERDTTREVFFLGNRTGYTGIYRRVLDDPSRENNGTLVLQGEKSNELEAFHPFRTKIDISPRGVLAFVVKSGEQDVLHLYDVHLREVVRTFRFKDLVSLGSSSWASDGRRLAFNAIDRAGNNDLYTLDTESGELQQLTRDYYDDRDPAWDPLHDRIAFSSDRTASGTYNLFLYDLTTGALRYLTQGQENDHSPAWSRDGARVAFTSDLDGVENIWVVPSPGPSELQEQTQRRQVTHFVTSAFDPAWTSAGDLVFSVFEEFSFRITTIDSASLEAERAGAVRSVVLAERGEPWQARRIDGESTQGTFRYDGDYSLDIAQSAISTDPVFGTTGGAVVALSDMLGNDKYYFLLYNTAQAQSEFLSSFNIAISRVSLAQRASYAYGIYRFSGRRYDITAEEEYYFERAFGAYVALSYPLSKFQRIETSVSLTNSSRELDGRIEARKALLLSNSLSFVLDNSLWVASGPVDGHRFNITAAVTTDIQYSNVNYFTVILDYRHYARLAQRSAFAQRFWLFYNDGRESRRFVMGGSWDLRGYPLWSIRGQKLWLISQELRFPFLDRLALLFPFGGLSFWQFRGALFFDAGGAWDRTYRETLGSIGGGLRLNLGGVLVLRYDLGKRIEDNFTRLQSGLFHQFFFGWDF
jgi:hypothetical protein